MAEMITIDVLTLDSIQCAACGYMMESIAALPSDVQEMIQYKEWSIKNKDGIGKFMEVGLAAYMYMNNVEDRYMLMDLFLMPGQMLPEHWHVEGEGNPAKREGWLVRCGLSHIVGVGEPNLGPDVVVPKSHWDGKVTTKHETVAKPGMFVPLDSVETRHWQFAGPEGAIITEVANVHTNSAVRHSDPVMNEYFLNS